MGQDIHLNENLADYLYEIQPPGRRHHLSRWEASPILATPMDGPFSALAGRERGP